MEFLNGQKHGTVRWHLKSLSNCKMAPLSRDAVTAVCPDYHLRLILMRLIDPSAPIIFGSAVKARLIAACPLYSYCLHRSRPRLDCETITMYSTSKWFNTLDVTVVRQCKTTSSLAVFLSLSLSFVPSSLMEVKVDWR